MRPVTLFAPLAIAGVFSVAMACSGEEGGASAQQDGGGQGSSGSSGTSGSSGSSSTSGSSGSSGDSGTDASEGGTDAGKSVMTFFVTSTGSGAQGANLGGLAGADAKCASLAAAVGGSDHTWRAYLSTSNVDAKDRIGAGPWRNQKGVVIAANLAALHATGPKAVDVLDEKGAAVPASGRCILTGTHADGTTYTGATASDWTATGGVWMGHADAETSANATDKWNDAHIIGGTQATMAAAGGEGRTYCFAAD